MRPLALLCVPLAFCAAYRKTYRLVVFKNSRTGSTWMADMLNHEPAVDFFAHEANNCFHRRGSDPRALRFVQNDTFHTFLGILGAPRCNMSCIETDHFGVPKMAAEAAVDPRSRPECLADKIVGFDVAADHVLRDGAPALSWDLHWPFLLKLPDVFSVVYARSNLVKRAVSARHVDVFQHLCFGTHKVVSEKAHACYEQHKAELDAPLNVSGEWIIKHANTDATHWVELLENVTKASGAPPFVMFYENLLVDPKKELERLFRAVGLGRHGSDVDVVAQSTSLKITPDDLRLQIADFAAVEADLDKEDPCLGDMLRDTSDVVYEDICLPHRKRVPWEPVSAA